MTPSSKRRRSASALAVLAVTTALLTTVGATGATGATGAGGVARRATAGTLSFSDAVVPPSTRVTLSGSLPPKRARTVKLQRRVSGSWKTVTSKKSGSAGRFSFGVTSASAAGKRSYRVLAPAASLGGKRYAAVSTPVRTLTVVRLVDVDAGWRHACAIGSNGRAWCWGDNTYGELGDGKGATFDDGNPLVSEPVRVTGTGWRSISTTGSNTCGVKQDDTGWCWGDAANWIVGVDKAPAPVQVAGRWKQLAPGWSYACGVTTKGVGRCWGQDLGQLGSADPVPQGTRYTLPGSWLMVVPGSGSGGAGNPSDSTCGVRTDATAWCWGSDDAGKLGNGAADDSAVPVQVSGDHAWRSVTVGAGHACGVTTDAAAWCWGANTAGDLGDGGFDDSQVPVRVTVAAAWRSLDAGFQHTCGVTTGGAGWCWGWNDQGQLGDGTDETSWFPDPKAHRLDGTSSDVAAGHEFSVGTFGGVVRAWGLSTYGQTGHGKESRLRLTPRKVAINP